jgi:glycosyltransferase involved in cell wall biosynthesis
MSLGDDRVRVLYSFPHKLGADRICYTAWQEVNCLAAAGADVLAFPGVLHRPVAANVTVRPTLAWKKLRISYKLLGKMRALALHDHIVARRIEKLAGKIDIIHAWPVAALETLKTAARLGIPTVLDRPNAHTRFAFGVVKREFERLGVNLPPDDEYYYRGDVLKKEEAEYGQADFILCPSDFVVRTFVDQGIPRAKLLRHTNGFDQNVFHQSGEPANTRNGLRMLFVGVCAVRKGLHFALEAWLKSPASQNGTFLIAGQFLPAYRDKLAAMLSHPSVKVLGQRNDVPELMRNSDLLVLPSIEEGFGLVIAEAIGSGCVPLASDACTEICRHMENGLVHSVGDVGTLTCQITMLHENRSLLGMLRTGCLKTAHEFTWAAAGVRLLRVYREAIDLYRQRKGDAGQLMGQAFSRPDVVSH